MFSCAVQYFACLPAAGHTSRSTNAVNLRCAVLFNLFAAGRTSRRARCWSRWRRSGSGRAGGGAAWMETLG